MIKIANRTREIRFIRFMRTFSLKRMDIRPPGGESLPGAHYRQYIRVGRIVVMADSADPRPTGAVRLVLPSEKVQVYGQP